MVHVYCFLLHPLLLISFHFMDSTYSYFGGHYSTLFAQNHGCKIPFILLSIPFSYFLS
ncbi:hypothetical protein HOY82DRAFT_550023 [Tuber indicum]|nr:hypothetical protein HOY82DRAFT_550023 [Tuber indicum]